MGSVVELRRWSGILDRLSTRFLFIAISTMGYRMPVLDWSSRRVPKATYVPLVIPLGDIPNRPGAALAKTAFVSRLALQPGDVAAVRTLFDAQRPASDSNAGPSDVAPATAGDRIPWEVLSAYEGSGTLGQLPSHDALSGVAAQNLVNFANALADIRRQAALQPAAVSTGADPADATAPVVVASPITTGLGGVGIAVNAYASTVSAIRDFQSNVAATPIGMLNLERLEMTPIAVQRGELIATIPLAPGETTSVIQKEWSVTSSEFTSIVTDSLENYSETGVTEKSELAQATDSQVKHSNQFNINSSVSGSYGFVTASVAASYSVQDETSTSAKDSRSHAVATTRKASSRVKQEHKVTISTNTESGTSLSTTRSLVNPSTTDAMRIDYFSMMRKWRVRLWRFGLRLTYDIAVFEPGSTLRESVVQLDALKAQAAAGFTFNVPRSSISPGTYQALADTWGTAVPAPPASGPTLTSSGTVPGLNDGQEWHFFELGLDVPSGFEIVDVHLDAHVGIGSGFGAHAFQVEKAVFYDHSPKAVYSIDLTKDFGNFMLGSTGHQSVTTFFQWASAAWVGLTVTTKVQDSALQEWVNSVWSALYNAAQTSFYANQQALNARIASLEEEMNGVDTLTLRREENDEIMKGALRWLLGPAFDFMPASVLAAITTSVSDPTHGLSSVGNELNLSPAGWSTMFRYGEMIKFINEAIEWENVLFFNYSYFWDVPTSWDYIRRMRHPDLTRQAFLRAGSARVVLTIRPGYEQAWTSFVELGAFSSLLPPDHPYMTIAQEIEHFNNTNYPGIPPANPAGVSADIEPAFTTGTADVVASSSKITVVVVSSDGFAPGSSVIIATVASGAQERQTVVSVPDSTHLTLSAMSSAHAQPFPIVAVFEAGMLIGEWNEYTPSPGVDIAVTSNLTTIA